MRRPAVGRSIEEAERVEWERERSRGSGKGERVGDKRAMTSR